MLDDAGTNYQFALQRRREYCCEDIDLRVTFAIEAVCSSSLFL